MITKNQYKEKCCICSIDILPGQGFTFKKNEKVSPVCVGYQCVKRACPKELPSYKKQMKLMETRRITSEGIIDMPYEKINQPLVESMPGAEYLPEIKKWKVSLDLSDRQRVIELAKRLKLDIPDEIKKYEISDHIKNSIRLGKKVGAYDFQIKGIEWLASQESCMLADQMGLGKAQPLDAKILTPSGWIEMGQLKVGDFVIGSSGEKIKISGVFPQDKKKTYKVIFSDHSSTECCNDHLWAVNTAGRKHRKSPFLIKSLDEIKNDLIEKKSKNYRWQIPIVKPIKFKKKILDIDPYVLGCLLGDGCLRMGTPSITSADSEIITKIQKLIGKDFILSKQGEYGYNIIYKSSSNSRTNPLTKSLRKLNMMGLKSSEKYIPHDYMFSSIEDRIKILRGLMDTDGYVSKDGYTTEFYSTSKQLANDVQFLIQSLGGTAKIKSKDTHYICKKTNKRVDCKKCYILSVNIPTNPFSLSRKANIWKKNEKYKPVRVIREIVEVGEKECQCIKVESKDRLYVTDDCILTHNTLQILISHDSNYGLLVVAPTHLKLNWKDEVNKWRPDLDVTILKDGKYFKYPEPGEIVITTYGLLPWWLELPPRKRKNLMIEPEEIEAAKKVVVVYDEAQALKNNKTKQSKRARELSKYVHKSILTTGTPIMNRQMELWNLFHAARLELKVFGSFPNFLRLFRGRRGNYSYEFKSPRPETAEVLRRCMLRRTKEEVEIELPDKTYKVIHVDISSKVRKEMDNAWDLFRESKYYQDDNLPPIEEMSKIKKALAKSKIPILKEVINELQDQGICPLVFSAHIDPIKTIGKRKNWGTIIGSEMTPEEKHEVKNKFQAGKLKGLAATILGAGTGLTLTYTNYIIFNDLDWVPANNEQAEARACRIGQKKKKVVIYHLVADHPLDRHIHKLILKKMELKRDTLDTKIEVDHTSDASSAHETEKDFKNRVQAVKDEEQKMRTEAILSRLSFWEDLSLKSWSPTAQEIRILQKEAKKIVGERPKGEEQDRGMRILSLLCTAGLKTKEEHLLAAGILKRNNGVLGADAKKILKVVDTR